MAGPAGPSKGCEVSAAAADCCATREKSGHSEPACCWPTQLLFGGAPWPAKQPRRPVREKNIAVVLPETEVGRNVVLLRKLALDKVFRGPR